MSAGPPLSAADATCYDHCRCYCGRVPPQLSPLLQLLPPVLLLVLLYGQFGN